MKFAASLVLAAVATVLATPASAQFAKPEDAVKYRQSALFVMSQHFGRIGAMTSGKAPYDAKAAVANAEIVAAIAKLPWPPLKRSRYRPAPSPKSGPRRPSSRRTASTWWPRPASCWRPPRPTTWTA